MSGRLNVSVSGHVGILEMNNGPANFFDAGLLAAVADAAERLQAGRDCRALVLCSAGRHFCAGADFGSDAGEDRGRADRAAELYQQGARLFDIELPVVAALNGAAVGGGLGLACAADFRVGSAATRLQANFAALGFHHGFGLSVTLPRVVGEQRALDLLLTARRVGGEEARGLGLLDVLAEAGSERDAALELAQTLAAGAPLAVRSIRATMRGGLAEQVRQCLKRELAEQARLWQTRDSQIGIEASIARTVPQFISE